ncbi:metalloreductase, variant 2 [Coprinopsis cinerea AmutBmut pab1-1]|nr:metalloreductase, variant 2 [Coprinopsis cinerea AmutBmut pab1-1]
MGLLSLSLVVSFSSAYQCLGADPPGASTPNAHNPHSRMTVDDILLRRRNDRRHVREVWIFLGSVLVFFTIVNFFRKLLRLVARRRGAKSRSPRATAHAGHTDAEKAEQPRSAPQPPASVLSRVASSISTVFRIVAFRWSLWLGPNNLGSLGELAFILLYISANLIWLLVDTRNLNIDWYKTRAGMIATSQIPLVVGLANKNNVVSYLTGVGHEKLNVLHRASGRTVLFFLWIHAVGRVINGLPPHTDFTHHYMQAGIAGLAALTIGTFLSMRIFRQALFEFFYYGHIFLMLIFVITGFIHVYPLGYAYYIWPSFILWGLDRAIRLGGVFWNNVLRCTESNKAQATVELLTPDTIQLTMQRKFSWKPGQHAYVCIPKISRLPFEFHPFTIATIPENLNGTRPEEKTVAFFIRSREGVTRRLRKYISENGSGSVTAYVDGPYGAPPDLSCYSTAILIAGGSGISYTLPLLLDLIRRSSTGARSDVERVKFVWVVRGEGHLPWINSILSEALMVVKQPLVVDACIYVTGTSVHRNTSKLTSSISKTEKDILFVEPEITESYLAKIYHGRPNLQELFDEEITNAQGPVSVDIAGPFGLTESVKGALGSGAASAGSVLNGRHPVTLHVETFGMGGA